MHPGQVQRFRRPVTSLTLVVALGLVAPIPADGTPGSAHERTACRAGQVSMTFDDGPAPGLTPRLLKMLRTRHVPATFFMNGNKVAAAPKVARLVERSGFLVANHGYDHADMTGLSEPSIESTIRRTDIELHRAGVHPVRLMRPPYGAVDGDVYTAARRTGHVVVIWDVDPRDWDYRSTDQIADSVLAQLDRHESNIVLLHDGVVNSPRSVDAVPRIIAAARRRGYCFVALDERGRPGYPTPTARLSVTERAVREGGKVKATVSLPTPAGRDTSVRLALVAGTARPGEDLVVGTKRVRIPAGAVTADVRLPAARDGLDEDAERLTIGLESGAGLLVDGVSTVVTIEDRDRPVKVSGEPASVAEPASGTTQVPVVLRLSEPSGREVRLTYRTVPGTAGSSDFIGTSGTVTIPPGSLTATVSVSVYADLEPEGPETFTVHLDRAEHADVRVRDAVVTIS